MEDPDDYLEIWLDGHDFQLTMGCRVGQVVDALCEEYDMSWQYCNKERSIRLKTGLTSWRVHKGLIEAGIQADRETR